MNYIIQNLKPLTADHVVGKRSMKRE